MNTRTRPERNLETLEHEPEKCDWKTTDTQKMRSRKCRTGPSVCGKRPPNSSIYVSTSEVKTTTEGITTLSSAGLVAWESAGCQPHRKTPRSRKFNSTENMKTTSETETLQQHPQASAEWAPRQAARRRRENGKKRRPRRCTLAASAGGPSYLDADARPLGAAAATAQSLATTLNALKLLKPPHSGRLAHGTQPP